MLVFESTQCYTVDKQGKFLLFEREKKDNFFIFINFINIFQDHQVLLVKKTLIITLKLRTFQKQHLRKYPQIHCYYG